MKTRDLARLIAAAALVATATGCWPQPGANAARTHYNGLESRLTVDRVGSLEEVWAAPMELGPVWGASAIGLEISHDGTPGSVQLDAVSRDAATGAVRWRADLRFPSEFVPPEDAVRGYGNPIALVGDELWTSVALRNAENVCTEAWARIDAHTGEVTHGTMGGLVPVTLVPYGDLVYTHRNHMCIANPTRPTIVDASTGAIVWYPSYGFGRAVVSGGRLLLTSDGQVLSFAAAGCGQSDCTPQWVANVGAPSGVALVDAGTVVGYSSAGGTGTLIALDPATGARRWTATLPAGERAMGTASTDGTLFVAHGSTLSAYPLAGCGSPSCQPVWTAPLDAPADGGVIGGAGVIYVATETGTVQAFDATGCGSSTCAEVGRVAVDGSIEKMVVDGGRLYVQWGAWPSITTTVFAPRTS